MVRRPATRTRAIQPLEANIVDDSDKAERGNEHARAAEIAQACVGHREK